MGAGGRDPFGAGGAPALEAGQPTVGQGQDTQAPGQAGDGGGNAFGRRLGQLRQGVVQRQQVQQQLQPCLGAARGMAAVLLDRDLQRAVQRRQGATTQALPRRPGQDAAADGRRRQPLGPAGQSAGRTQQLARLARQAVGQGQPFRLGRDRPHPSRRAGQIDDPTGQDFRPPGEGRPSGEGIGPGHGQPKGLARAAIPLSHQRRQPGEGVQFHRERPGRAGPVPRIARRLHLHGGAGQHEPPGQHIAARRRIVRAEVARRGGEGADLAPLQRQPIARQAVKLDPQLARRQPPGDGGPQAGAGRGVAGAHGRPDGRAGQAGNLARGHVQTGVLATRGEGTERAHARSGAAFRAAILAA